MTSPPPWTRYVAIGDSFTEGIGDPEPASPGGTRGWADRVAEVLSAGTDDFAYANLAIRGKPLGRSRGKVAIDNENLRTIAQRHDAIVADMWSLRELQDPRMWAPDRLHFSPLGHHTTARMVLASLTVENDLEPYAPEALPIRSWRQARADDTGWAREHLMPWVVRRIRHQSSGDNITAKRPMTGSVSFGQSIEEAKHHTEEGPG